jgi:dTDP-4-amino-4,6-dideoxygalactose transaminase
MIPFNRPYLTGAETDYIKEAVATGKISGDGMFTKRCHEFFEKKYGFKKCLLTTSCTDALEMAAILINIQQGDEIIIPSFTFVSTANAFVLRGAKIVFADSRKDHPGIDEDLIEGLITDKTKAIVPVHYAGVACDMEKIMNLASKYNLYVIEDAAQAVDSFYQFSDGTTKPLGGIGHLAAFSFHETKNVISGEGGMLVINDEQFIERAEIVREKGTNRSKFFRGEIDKYGWVDIGSSFLPSEITAAFLWAQLENLDKIQRRRNEIWNYYHAAFLENNEKLAFTLPVIPGYATNNAHMYYIVFENTKLRAKVIALCKSANIHPVFHYQSLHRSPFFGPLYERKTGLENADRYSDCLLRLPFYFELTEENQELIISCTTQHLLLDTI